MPVAVPVRVSCLGGGGRAKLEVHEGVEERLIEVDLEMTATDCCSQRLD